MSTDAAVKAFLAELAAAHRAPPVRAATREAYKSARVDRFNKAWQPEHRSGDAAIWESSPLTTARTRDMVRNDAVFKKAKSELEKLVIGSGLQTFADALDERFESLDAFNDESDFVWQHWAEKEADVERKLSWFEMEKLAFGEMPEVGDCLLLRCQDHSPGRMIPLCYQVIEKEQLDRSKDRPAASGQNKIVHGIEMDEQNIVVGYHLFGAHPYDLHADLMRSSQSTLVPAERVVHGYLPMRPSASCGISWFTAILQPTRDMDWLLGNELTSSAIQSLLTMVVKRNKVTGDNLGLLDDDEDSDSFGNTAVKLGRGIVAEIHKDEDIEMAESKRPGRSLEPFIKLLLQFQAMGCGLSYHRLTGDTQRSSYTAIRASHLDDAAMVRPLQQFYGRKVSLRVRSEHTQQAAAFGRYKRMSAGYLLANQWRTLRFDVIGPGREQLDPEKETIAALDRIRGGTSTLKIECGLRGLHYRAVLRQLAKEKQLCEELGLDFIFAMEPAAAPPRQEKAEEEFDDEDLDDEELA